MQCFQSLYFSFKLKSTILENIVTKSFTLSIPTPTHCIQGIVINTIYRLICLYDKYSLLRSGGGDFPFSIFIRPPIHGSYLTIRLNSLFRVRVLGFFSTVMRFIPCTTQRYPSNTIYTYSIVDETNLAGTQAKIQRQRQRRSTRGTSVPMQATFRASLRN